jgi:arsenite oxidase small subunit
MDDHASSRRDLMREAACVAGAFAAAGAWPTLPAAATTLQRHGRSLLVDAFGEPLRSKALQPGEPMLFNYPFVSSPVFLLALDAAVVPTDVAPSEGRGNYASPAGVGARRSIVAFCAICSHRLVYPTPQLSFIGVRKGAARGEPQHVIHCCGDDSRYDPAQGARVLAGPAPQPLAAVQLEWQDKDDTLHAVGVVGAEPFDAFFEKYAFKLEMEYGGGRARTPAAATVVVKTASAYSKQWQRCPA